VRILWVLAAQTVVQRRRAFVRVRAQGARTRHGDISTRNNICRNRVYSLSLSLSFSLLDIAIETTASHIGETQFRKTKVTTKSDRYRYVVPVRWQPNPPHGLLAPPVACPTVRSSQLDLRLHLRLQLHLCPNRCPMPSTNPSNDPIYLSQLRQYDRPTPVGVG
jgi:hypothetical protein